MDKDEILLDPPGWKPGDPKCPLDGDPANNCEDCPYSCDYRYDGGECLRIPPDDCPMRDDGNKEACKGCPYSRLFAFTDGRCLRKKGD